MGMEFMLRRYIYFPLWWQSVIVTLWIAHTYFFDRFMVTPRLVVTSATQRCGKSTLVELIEYFAARPYRVTDSSKAALYDAIDEMRPTVLVDDQEWDKQLPGYIQKRLE
jgi:hypothetical protein